MNTILQEDPSHSIDLIDPKQFIIIKGARVNNLQNLSVAIPRNKLVVITGLSGSGKSSLAFDTLFAEGQRMYVESLSSYARQFLGRMEKPEVDYIKGIAPAISIEQKVNTRNPRSTVGTTTEIYDYLKLLFSRAGETVSPVSGTIVKKDSVGDVADFLSDFPDGTKYMISCPLVVTEGRSLKDELSILLSKGYSRVIAEGEVSFIEDLLDNAGDKLSGIKILIDRNSLIKNDEDNQFRIFDSIQTAFYEGHGECIIETSDGLQKSFSDRFEADGIVFEEPSINLFSFNNPYGACRRCDGFGKILGIDPDLVIPDKSLSVFEGAIVPWRSETMRPWLDKLLKQAHHFDFPIHRPVNELSEEAYEVLWTGNKYFEGINAFFEDIESKSHKIQYRVMLSRYRGRTVCPECKGTRLRKDAGYVKFGAKSIIDLVLMPIEDLSRFFKELEQTDFTKKVTERILKEIVNRLQYLEEVGLGYLTLNRMTSSLSGGEYQRIKLATSLGSALVGSMYILDEPSIGLHPRDTSRLVRVLKRLRDLGNTVIVVEHEEEIMKAADQIIDIGPDAGSHGGKLIFQGNINELLNSQDIDTHTARYLSGREMVPMPTSRRSWKYAVEIKGARENNLKNIDVKIPLGCLTVITGVSGSGKSTLVKSILYPSLGKMFGVVSEQTGKFDKLEGDYSRISGVEFVDQNPIGKSSRSNPVTYVKAYDAIRQLYASQSKAKARNYKASHFSFNVEGGRCETCEGEGTQKIEMQFMADIYLTCETCKGKRFKEEILEILYKEKSISDVLEMTIDDALIFFKDQKPVASKLKPLQDVGLGYVRLGQSSNTLSGGEAQRVKLASYLGKGRGASAENMLFIFDEPTTGLHFHDISKLLKSINALIDAGNSVIIIEHNTEVIKTADWIIDIGPEGGQKGGNVVFQGTPEEMINLTDNHTARFLQEKFN
ncbi:MAG: excinuclease ABC subunit UvrA [Cyclobacteriaceae bacterium]